MGLFSSIAGFVKQIPLVGDLLGGATAAAFDPGDVESLVGSSEGFISRVAKKGVKAVLSGNNKLEMPSMTDSSSRARSYLQNPSGISLPRATPSGYLPGLSNNYVRSLYQLYDLNKLRSLELITDRDQVRAAPPEGPRAPNLKIGR